MTFYRNKNAQVEKKLQLKLKEDIDIPEADDNQSDLEDDPECILDSVTR